VELSPQDLTDFQILFGRPAAYSASAPGRVNLIGEHTDYNGGFVLPLPIPLRTVADLAPRRDHIVRAWSTNVGGDPLVYSLGAECSGRGWLDYIQGLTKLLSEEGHPLRGVDLRIESSLPLGSGLASSAALEVAVLRVLCDAFNLSLTGVEQALIGQRAENEFVGARVGIMDQMAASIAEPGEALFIDTRSLRYERLLLTEEAELVVISSGVSHSHAAGQYNARRAECERACTLLGVEQLRDLSAADLPVVARLPQPFARRARHVITENERVLEALQCLRSADLPSLGRLLYASHESLRDDYQVSIPELDLLVELAAGESEVYGARLTGGGFGGSMIVLTHRRAGRAVAERIAREYARRTTRASEVLLPL
jgi:galactokinase